MYSTVASCIKLHFAMVLSGVWMQRHACGIPLFQVSAGVVNVALRQLLSRVDVRDADKYRTHDLRRG